MGVIPLIENPIQLTGLGEVNGGGVMLSDCGLFDTLSYLR